MNIMNKHIFVDLVISHPVGGGVSATRSLWILS